MSKFGEEFLQPCREVHQYTRQWLPSKPIEEWNREMPNLPEDKKDTAEAAPLSPDGLAAKPKSQLLLPRQSDGTVDPQSPEYEAQLRLWLAGKTNAITGVITENGTYMGPNVLNCTTTAGATPLTQPGLPYVTVTNGQS